MFKSAIFRFNILVIYFCICFLTTKAQYRASFENGQNEERSSNCDNADDEIALRHLKDDIKRLQAPVIQTLSGKIRGKKVAIDNDYLLPVIQYLGIPYAEPPIGDLRWKKTQEKGKWPDILNATEFGASCPQALESSLPSALLPEWRWSNGQNISKLMNEDCLYLNIYVPAKYYTNVNDFTDIYSKKLAVMVHFHGETFSEGSGTFYDASVLSSVGEIIVVTFNYRLGMLGFLSTMTSSAPGNYGLWDQLAVLEWISKNILQFGGDPKRVTAFGSGAGAASVGILMLSEQTEGIRFGNISRAWFRRAILQSGSAVANWSIVSNSQQYAKLLARNSNISCPDDLSEEMVECLRNRSWKSIVDVPLPTAPFAVTSGPVVDGTSGLLKQDPIALLEKGEFTDYSVILGINQGDGIGGLKHFINLRNRISGQKNLDSINNALYDEKGFDSDIFSFIQTSFENLSNSTTVFLREVIKFVYADYDISEEKINSTRWKMKMVDILTDSQFAKPAIQKAFYQAKHNHPAYFYTFYQLPGVDGQRSWFKSSIGDENLFVFGAPLLQRRSSSFSYNFTKTDESVSAAVMTYWTNFAKYGIPTIDTNSLCPNDVGKFKDVKWPRYEFNSRSYLQISSTPQLGSYYKANKIELWTKFLPTILNMSNHGMTFEFSPNREQQYAIKSRESSKNWFSAFTTGPSFTSQKSKAVESNDINSMSVQLSMTLAVGFVLLFVNIIAFAIVSYRKEQDKIVIEKLKSELARYKKRDVARINKKKSPKTSNNHLKTISSDSVLEIKPTPKKRISPLETTRNKCNNTILPLQRQEESISSPNDSLYGCVGPTNISKPNYLLSASELHKEKYPSPIDKDAMSEYHNETNAEMFKEYRDMIREENVIKIKDSEKNGENYHQKNFVNVNGMTKYPTYCPKTQLVLDKPHQPLRKTLPKQSRFSSSVCTSDNGSEKDKQDVRSRSHMEIYSFRENDFSENPDLESQVPLLCKKQERCREEDRRLLLVYDKPLNDRFLHYNSQPLFNDYRQLLVHKQLSESNLSPRHKPQKLIGHYSFYQPEERNMRHCGMSSFSTTTTKL